MPHVIVAGGGLAGLSAAAALGSAGFDVEVFESRPFLGGRASSFPLSPSDPESPTIDNCQHILLRCCRNLLDFYQRLGVRALIRFSSEFHFVEPGGRLSVLKRGTLPPPLHLAGAFLRLRFLDAADKLSIARGLAAMRLEHSRRDDLDRISMLDWLREKRQSERAVRRFWAQVLVSAINELPERMAAVHGFQVFRLGFLGDARNFEMGVPAAPLGDLYGAEKWARFSNVRLRLRCPVEELSPEGVRAGDGMHRADYYICALPPDRAASVAPSLAIDTSWIEYSPITGIHLWFDRPVTYLPHATLLDRTIQWMFNKNAGRYLQLVVSASRGLIEKSRAEVIHLALHELAEFFPRVREAQLQNAQVIKEARATFSAAPGTEQRRPGVSTNAANVFLSGDWTRSGWPATMEGAVRSGYRAAEAVTAAAGMARAFVLPDPA